MEGMTLIPFVNTVPKTIVGIALFFEETFSIYNGGRRTTNASLGPNVTQDLETNLKSPASKAVK